MCLIIKLKATKNQGFAISLESTVFEKTQVVLGLQKSKEHHEESDRIKNTFVLYKQKQLLRFID